MASIECHQAFGEEKDHLEVVSIRESAEDASDDDGQDKRAEDRLQKDGVLNLAEGWLLNPDFAIKDLADNIALLVFGDPWLVLVAVG